MGVLRSPSLRTQEQRWLSSPLRPPCWREGSFWFSVSEPRLLGGRDRADQEASGFSLWFWHLPGSHADTCTHTTHTCTHLHAPSTCVTAHVPVRGKHTHTGRGTGVG